MGEGDATPGSEIEGSPDPESAGTSAPGVPQAHPATSAPAATQAVARVLRMAPLPERQCAQPVTATTRSLDSASGSGATTFASTTDPFPEMCSGPSPVDGS